MIIGICGKSKSGKDTAADFLVHHHNFVKVALADPLKRICRDVYDFSVEQLWGPSQMRNQVDRRYVRLGKEECRKLFDPKIDQWHDTPEPGCALHEYLGLTEEEYADFVETGCVHLTPRFALQQLGTEWGRDCYSETWVNYCVRVANRILSGEAVRYEAPLGLIPWHSPMRSVEGIVISDVRFINEVVGLRSRGAKNVRVYRPKSGLVGAAGQHRSETEQDGILDSEFDAVIHNDASLEELYLKTTMIYREFSGEEKDDKHAHDFEKMLRQVPSGKAYITNEPEHFGPMPVRALDEVKIEPRGDEMITVSQSIDYGPTDAVVEEKLDVKFDELKLGHGPVVKLDDGVEVLPEDHNPQSANIQSLLDKRAEDVKAGRLMEYDPSQSNIPPFKRRR